MTKFQRLLLENLAEDGTWDYTEADGIEKRSLAKMEEAGLVATFNYVNGTYWEITDKGYAALEN